MTLFISINPDLSRTNTTTTLNSAVYSFCASSNQNKEYIQLNRYKNFPYFLQIFQSNTSVCLIISLFCKSCEPVSEPEITPVFYHLENQNKNNFTFSVQFTNLTKCGNEQRHALEIL